MSSLKSPLPVAQEPTLFEGAVRERSWEWLLELRRRLKVELLLVDARPSVLLPAPGEQSARLQSLLEQGEPALVSAISGTLRNRTAHVAEFGALQTVCLAIAVDRRDSGVLLVARTVPPGQGPTASRAQLQLVTSWLATAVEAHLLSPPSLPSSGLSRVAPLAKVLGQSAERESDRELIRLFGEAIAVWHDIEVCGYVETPDGAFARDVTLPGANKGEGPLSIPAEELPESVELTRLPHGHLDRFGLPVNCDVYVSRLGASERSWLLLFTGVIDGHDLQRLGAYLALLELALGLSTSVITTRVVNAIGSRLVDLQQTPDTRARNALEELRTALGTSSAALKIESSDGSLLFQAHSPDLGHNARTDRGAPRLVLVKRSEQHYTTTVSLGRYESLQFTPRDYAVASAAATVFEFWVPATLSTTAGRRERRALGRGFQEVIERSAREAIQRGVPIAVVVLLIRDAVSLPGSTQRWVTGIRGQMRASDVAGMLTEGEIGLLLHDIANGQAKAIAERLRTAVSGAPGRETILIGVASWAPGQSPGDGIVRKARADALADSRRTHVSVSSRGVNN